MTVGETDEHLAERLANAAGEILLDLRASGEFVDKALGRVGDARANAMLMDELRAARPSAALGTP